MVTKDIQWWTFDVLRLSTIHNRYNSITRTPYAPYAHPLCALRAPLTCLMRTPYLMRLTCTPYMPYAHPLCHTCLTRTPYNGPYAPLLTCLTDRLTDFFPTIRTLLAGFWLVNVPTTSNQINGIQQPHSHKILITRLTRTACRILIGYSPPPYEFNNLINIKSWFFSPPPYRALCAIHALRTMLAGFWLVNVPTTSNQINGIQQPHSHKILIFSPPPYVPYVHCLQDSNWLMSPPHPIRSDGIQQPHSHKILIFSPPPYAPYAHCLQDSDWLMSPPHPIRSMELNNLINIKSWFFSPPPLWKVYMQPE